jgi:hypothetical protein
MSKRGLMNQEASSLTCLRVRPKLWRPWIRALTDLMREMGEGWGAKTRRRTEVVSSSKEMSWARRAFGCWKMGEMVTSQFSPGHGGVGSGMIEG